MAKVNKSIEELVQEYFTNKALMERFQQRAEEIKDTIKEAMIEQGIEELDGLGWRATWHSVSTRRLNQKKLKTQCPDVYSEYSETTTGTRFTLNLIK
jgi:predicted phage-related endonuclease